MGGGSAAAGGAPAQRDPDVIFLGKSALRSQQPAPAHDAVEKGAFAATQVLRRMVERPFLRAGSVYQNAHMSLLNDSGTAISTALHIHEGDRFELVVSSLDSKGGGSEGWIKFRGTMTLELVQGRADVKRVVLRCEKPAEAIEYDEELLNWGTSFAFGCLKRMTRAVLDNLRLEVNTREDALLLRPQGPLFRLFWAEPVGLQRTTEQQMWTSRSAEAGQSSDPLAMFTPSDWPQLQVGVGVLAASGGEAPAKLAVAL